MKRPLKTGNELKNELRTEVLTFKHKGKNYTLQCITGGKGPQVFLTAGLHGNEPAGVLMLQEFIKKEIRKYLDTFSFTIIPCINPVGRERNTRGNDVVHDLNRQFNAKNPPVEVKFVQQHIKGKYVFAFDFHEDPTDEPADNAPDEIPPEELYIYEISKKENSKGRLILSALEKKGFPLCKREFVYHEPCENGLLWAGAPSSEIPGTLYEFLSQYTPNAFTLETPTCWPLQRRIEAHLLALDTALRIFQQDKE